MDADLNGYNRRFTRSFSFRRLNKRFPKNDRNKFKKQNHKLKKSVSSSQISRLANDGNNVSVIDFKMASKSQSLGNLKRNSSFRRSISTRWNSLSSFRRKDQESHDTSDQEITHIGKEGNKNSLISMKRTIFRNRIMHRFRSNNDIRRERSKDILDCHKGNRYQGINNKEVKGRQRPTSTNVTMRLKSRLTSTSEEVDFTDLIKAVTFNKQAPRVPNLPIDNQTRLPKEVANSTKPLAGNTIIDNGDIRKSESDKDVVANNEGNGLDKEIFNVYSNGRDSSKADEVDGSITCNIPKLVLNESANTAKVVLNDSIDTTNTTKAVLNDSSEDTISNTSGMTYKDNGVVAIVECSPTSPSLVSPTCADIYGQDEGVDMSFMISNDHFLSGISHGNTLSGPSPALSDRADQIGNTVTDITVVIDSPKVSEVTQSGDKIEHNIAVDRSDINLESGSPGVETKVQKETIQLKPRRHHSMRHDLADILKNDKFLQLRDIKPEKSFTYEDVDNPWVMRSDFQELSVTKQIPDLKTRNFISEYSVDDSLGFSVNHWSDIEPEQKTSKKKTKYTGDEGGDVTIVRSDSVESIDSFSSSIHSVHSEDLFFSASEPEMDGEEVNASSDGSTPNTPGDKPKGLLRIDEADEQVSPAVLKIEEKGDRKVHNKDNKKVTERCNNKDSEKDLMVKSLNDLNKSDSNIISTPRRISSYLSGLKTFSFDSGEKGKVSKHDKLKQRRSLDSNLKIQNMSLDLNMNESPTIKNKLTSSSDSGLNSVLSPVIEKGNKSSKKTRRKTVDVLGDDDSVKFFTLPARRKVKSSEINESPRKRVTRISSISKMFSDKAQSLSSMRLGSSFKLRNNDGEKSKVPSFLKTSSLTNLMAKKGAEMASSISTLIRGRSNSNTVVNSPFKQSAKTKKGSDEEKQEFHYERVQVPCVRKRPVTSDEISAWKKRLTLNIELANSLTTQENMRLRSDSFIRKPNWSGSGSENGSLGIIRSPTLLDEIMKSVDNTRFRSLGSTGECDFDLDSDDEDSSNEGTTYVFRNQVSVCSNGSQTKHTDPFTICRKCRSVVNSNRTSTPHGNMTRETGGALNGKLSLSLCALEQKCKCMDSKFQCSKRLNFRDSSKRDSFISQTESSVTSPQSSEISEESSSLSSPNSSKTSDLVRSPKFASMFELRELAKQSQSPDSSDGLASDCDKECLELVGSGPGSLLRHRPMLDLSGDNLDVTDETDSGVVMYDMDRKSRERRSQSCDDVTSCDKMTPDGDSFYSCTDMTKSEIQSSTNVTGNLQPTKSHSCDDILNESENILIDSALKHEETTQHKKELRKVKVKSLSSSHDALSMFGQVEDLDIDIDEKLKSQGEEVDEIKRFSTYISESFDSNTKTNTAESHDKLASKSCSEDINTCDKSEHEKQNSSDDVKNALKICEETIGQDITVTKHSQTNGRQRTFSEKIDRNMVLSAKPPLPRKSHRKVLSVSDVRVQSDRNVPNSLNTSKRYSMIEMSRKTSEEQLLGTDSKSNKKVHKLRVKSQSCDYINTADSQAITPKTANKSQTNDTEKFLFDEEHIQSYTLKLPESQNNHTPIQKSVSSGNVPKESFDSQLSSNSSYSMVSLNRLSSHSYSDDVFRRMSSISPPQIALSPPTEKLLTLEGFIDVSGNNDTFSRFSDLPTPDVFPDISAVPDLDTELKYDVRLGYLLHSVQCDNRIVCFYSFQRNKQLMESVITPLAVLPGVQNKRTTKETNHVTPPKLPPKTKCEDLPNPAAPITSVPSERLLHAGQVLRTVLLARAPHMIRDRKFHLRTYRRCMVGTEMVDWLMQQCSLVHSRNQAVGMWQALVEEGVVVHVCHEHQFKDKYLFYRFHEDDEGVSTVPSNSSKRECEEELQEMFLMLAQIGPDAMMRMILRKLPHERTMEDLEIIYEELLHIKALSHLSTMVKRELASVLVFESHAKSGTVLFNQGDEGKSWYIILKGSVNVVIYGKGVVCTLHEGDDFGKLALVNDAPRAATIVLRDDNCHFLRVDKDDFNRILRDVEANTVRLKEHGQDVLVLEKIPSNTQSSDGTVHAHYKYSVMAGTPEKMLEHLLETRLDNKKEDEIDGFLEDFILTHVIFMPCNHLCPVLLSHYHSSATETTEQEAFEFMFNHKKCVLHFVQEWGYIVGPAFKEDHTINAFLEELHSCVLDDLVSYPSLRDDLVTLETVLSAQLRTPEGKSSKSKRASGNFTLSRKPSRDIPQDLHSKKRSIRSTDENIFKVYCADHTYSTLKLSMDTTVETLLLNIKEKLGLGDDLILCEVKSSGERIILKENDLCVTSGLSINGRLFVTPREHLDALTPLPEQEGPSDGTSTTIEMFSSREMAYYMTTYDWELFNSLQEYELIYQVFGRYKFQKITANLDLFLRRFNEIQFWVVTEMVLTTNLSKRVALLRKFIKLAAHCKEYQNLNSFFAVVMGLSNIAVSRLSQTWEKLPNKFKKMFVEFETLMDPSRNHRVYRLTVAKMAPPILPFMPLLMKDMTFTHEGNKTYFDGLVNFEKMRMISQTLKTVRFCRSSNIDLEMPGTTKSADAMSYIRNLHVIDNQRLLTKLSHKLEPRKT